MATRDPDAYLLARLRFKHLVLVEALGRLHSIRKAAQEMHVSEPAVSKALAEIEISFGLSLFERSSAGVTPTVRGDTVIEGARLLLNALRHVRRSAANAGQELILRLGANPFVAQTFLARLIGVLKAQTMDVQVELQEGPVPQLLRFLQEGLLDAMFIVMSNEDGTHQRRSDLVIRPLYSETLKIIAPADHRLVRRRRLSWSDLAGERWILPPAPAVLNTTIRNAFLAQGILPPTPWIQSAVPSTNVSLVAAGHGLSAVPAPFVVGSGASSPIAVLLVAPQAQLSPVSLVFRSGMDVSAGIRALELALKTVLAAR